MSDLPEPVPFEDRGVQTPPPPGTYAPTPDNPLPASVAQVIVGLANGRPRGLASEAGVALIAGWATEMSANLERTQREVTRLNGELNSTVAALGEQRTNVAVLTEQLHGAQGLRKRAVICLLAGPVLVGVAIDLYKSQMLMAAGIVGLIGAVVIGIGLIGDGRPAK